MDVALIVALDTRFLSTEMKRALPPVKGSSAPQRLSHIAAHRGAWAGFDYGSEVLR